MAKFIFLPYRRADAKFRCGLCSLQIFNAILLRFSRLLRNSLKMFGGNGQGIRHPFDPPAMDLSPIRASLSSKEEPCPLSPHSGFLIPCPSSLT